jgi:hypothetical protein
MVVGFEIRVCENSDLDALHAVINDGALAYHGIIPADCWSDPYMSFAHLQREIDDGVCFYSALRENELLGSQDGKTDVGWYLVKRNVGNQVLCKVWFSTRVDAGEDAAFEIVLADSRATGGDFRGAG